MFVGDVREATRRTGCSWKLSGGRWFSSAETNASKKSQVRRATECMKRAWFLESGEGIDAIGWLIAASAVAMVAPILFYRALMLGPMGLVAPLSATYPVWVLLVALAEGFRPSLVAWLAILLAAGGSVVVGRTAAADPDDRLVADPATRRQAIVMALFTSVAFAATLLTGARSAARVGSVTTLCSARLAGVVVIGCTRPWRGNLGFGDPRLWGLLLLQGALDNAAFLALYLGSQHGGAAITAVASSAFMVVAVLLAALFLKERLNLPCLAGSCAVFAGIAFLSAVAP